MIIKSIENFLIKFLFVFNIFFIKKYLKNDHFKTFITFLAFLMNFIDILYIGKQFLKGVFMKNFVFILLTAIYSYSEIGIINWPRNDAYDSHPYVGIIQACDSLPGTSYLTFGIKYLQYVGVEISHTQTDLHIQTAVLSFTPHFSFTNKEEPIKIMSFLIFVTNGVDTTWVTNMYNESFLISIIEDLYDKLKNQ